MLAKHLDRPSPALLLWLMAAGLLTACATAEDAARFDAGWRPGTVQAVGTAAELGPQHARLDCRPAAGDGDPATRFVQVRYAHGRLRRSVIAPLPPGQTLGIAQPVWVNSHECQPVELRPARG